MSRLLSQKMRSLSTHPLLSVYACEIPESQSKTTLATQKQEVVQVTFEQSAVSEHPQSCLPEDAKAEAAILVQSRMGQPE